MAKDYDAWESMFAEPSGSDDKGVGGLIAELAFLGVLAGGALYLGKELLNLEDDLNESFRSKADNKHSHSFNNLARDPMVRNLANGLSQKADVGHEHLTTDETLAELSNKLSALNERIDDVVLDRTWLLNELASETFRDSEEQLAMIRDLRKALMLHRGVSNQKLYDARSSERFSPMMGLGHSIKNEYDYDEMYTFSETNEYGRLPGHTHHTLTNRLTPKQYEAEHLKGDWKIDVGNYYNSASAEIPLNKDGSASKNSKMDHSGFRETHRAMHYLDKEHFKVGAGIHRNRSLSNDGHWGSWPAGEGRMRKAENEISDLESRYERNIYGQDGLRQYAMNHEQRISNLEDALA